MTETVAEELKCCCEHQRVSESFRQSSGVYFHFSSNLPQRLQEKRSEDFKKGRIDILVCTDICSRSIDVPHLDRVIIFDLPNNLVDDDIENFIHRDERTGRVKQGEAHTFVNLDK